MSRSRRPVTLADAGELGLLAELERRGLALDVEHDAAVLAGGLVVTQDALVEGVHFRLDWISWRDLGYKAAAVNISDLAASAAEPEALIVSLGLAPSTLVARRRRAVRGDRRGGRAGARRRHDLGRPRLSLGHGARPLRRVPRSRRRPARRPHRRHRAARRLRRRSPLPAGRPARRRGGRPGGRCARARPQPAAAAPRRGPRARRRRHRADGRLRRPRHRRRAHRATERLPPRGRAGARAGRARRRRGRRGPRPQRRSSWPAPPARTTSCSPGAAHRASRSPRARSRSAAASRARVPSSSTRPAARSRSTAGSTSARADPLAHPAATARAYPPRNAPLRRQAPRVDGRAAAAHAGHVRHLLHPADEPRARRAPHRHRGDRHPPRRAALRQRPPGVRAVRLACGARRPRLLGTARASPSRRSCARPRPPPCRSSSAG